ncbi:MAG: hypothetical protein ABWZ83_02435, partial [Mesorhizobium sp.]
APRGFTWTLAEQARTNMAASRRGGGDAGVSKHFEQLLRMAVERGGVKLPKQPLLLDLHWRSQVRESETWATGKPQWPDRKLGVATEMLVLMN